MSGKIAFVMPCAGAVEPRAVQSALNLVNYTSANGYGISRVGITERTLIHTARNWMSKEFLDTKDTDWIFWMDSDMILESRTIAVMMRWAEKLDAKMLTGIYCQRMGDYKPIIAMKALEEMGTGVVKSVKDEYSAMYVAPENWNVGPFQIDAAGFGCMLIHRDVYKDMEYPYFRFLFPDGAEKKPDSYISEDFYFCRQARKRGIEIWAIPELKCGHIGVAPIITKDNYKPDMSRSSRAKAVDVNKLKLEACKNGD